MVQAFRQKLQVMDGLTAFAAAPVNGEAGAPATYYTTPEGYKGMVLQVSIIGGSSFSLTFTIKSWDPYAATPAATATVLASAAKTDNTGFQLTVYPGAATTSNVSAGLVMPDYWTLAITGTTDTAKIKVVATYIP